MCDMLFGNVFVAIFFGHRKFYIEVFFFANFFFSAAAAAAFFLNFIFAECAQKHTNTYGLCVLSGCVILVMRKVVGDEGKRQETSQS